MEVRQFRYSEELVNPEYQDSAVCDIFRQCAFFHEKIFKASVLIRSANLVFYICRRFILIMLLNMLDVP